VSIIWKGRDCLNQNTLEPAIEFVGIYNEKQVSMFIDKQEINDYKVLTGRDLIEEKKIELRKKLV
jgi:hypothetical protein